MYFKTQYFIIILFIFCISLASKCTENKTYTLQESHQIAFYNVENLFDTIDDPFKNDEDFLPTSKKNWNTQKYNEKLINLAAVIDSLKPGLLAPEIVGLCEIENLNVLKDLVNQPNLMANSYEIVHYDSPDSRGIDVACLYNPKYLTLINSSNIAIKLPDDEQIKTRDILYCHFKTLSSKTSLHLYVNHWSSRSGGEAASSYKREQCASILLQDIQNRIPDYINQNIIIMGDMNDYPVNKSVYEILGAKEPSKKEFLTNYMYTPHQESKGTYFYKGEWGVLDHMIVSKSLRSITSEIDAVIYYKDWLLYTNSKGEKAPSRSYSGDTYYNGYSDHLPIYLNITLK